MKKKSMLSTIFKNNIILLAMYIVLSVLSGIVLSVSTNVRTEFIDSLVNNDSQNIPVSLIKNVCTIFLYSYLIPFGLIFLGRNIQKRISLYADHIINRKKVFIPYHYFEKQEINDQINLLNDASVQVWNFIRGCINLAGYVIESIFMFAIIAQLGIINSLIIILFFIPVVFYSVKSGMIYYDTWSRTAKLRRHSDYIRDILLDKTYAQERILFHYSPYFQKIWKKEYSEIRSTSIKEELKGAKRIQICGAAFCIYIGILLYILVGELRNGGISVGFAVSIISILPVFLNNVMARASQEINGIVRAKKSISTLDSFLKIEEVNYDKKVTVTDFKVIELKNVWFRYPNSEKWVIKDISMKIEKNKHYSIVGENGAGKTTFVNLLMGLYKPERGEILIDGKNLNDFSEAEIRGIFSALTQEPQRYETVLSENIGIGDIDRVNDYHAIAEVAKSIHIDEFINSLPNQYDTVMGTMFSGGINLSGGEWKKLSLSRLLMSKTLVKILDEPTASMDPKFEKWISEYFDKIMKNQTCFVVSHRLAFSKNVDQILVFDNGEICEMGSHEKLMEQRGIYYKMYTTQQSMYEDDVLSSAT